MKPADVKSGSYIEYNVNSNDKNPKFSKNIKIQKYFC